MLRDLYGRLNTRVGRAHPKRKFTPEEDARLLEIVEDRGTDDWQLIADLMPGRNVRQVRDRYENYLSPSVKNTPWTAEEDILLLQKLDEYGRMWRRISQYFPNRTDISIKSRYAQLVRQLKKSKFSNLMEMVNSRRNTAVVEPVIPDPIVFTRETECDPWNSMMLNEDSWGTLSCSFNVDNFMNETMF